MATKAQIRAVAKYESINYDKISARLPKGAKEKILSMGYTINGFVSRAVMDQLQKLENGEQLADDNAQETGTETAEEETLEDEEERAPKMWCGDVPQSIRDAQARALQSDLTREQRIAAAQELINEVRKREAEAARLREEELERERERQREEDRAWMKQMQERIQAARERAKEAEAAGEELPEEPILPVPEEPEEVQCLRHMPADMIDSSESDDEVNDLDDDMKSWYKIFENADKDFDEKYGLTY